MLAKFVLVVTGTKAKEACRTEQLCSGLEEGIKGGINAVRLMWQQHSQEEDWGFLLIDAHNAFNTAMMWTVQHKWPSGVWFSFNCYRYWATLVLREGNGTGHFLHIKEGATQVDTLSMVAYGLGTPSIIRDLRTIHPSVTQPWYADDAGAGGKISDMQHHLNEPMVRGPPWGYFTEPTKSILVLSPQNFPQAEAFFWGYGVAQWCMVFI